VSRNIPRVLLVLGSILLAVFIPFTLSGYSELKKAAASHSYVEMARHYGNAAERLAWRPDLYELAGHAFYYAKDY